VRLYAAVPHGPDNPVTFKRSQPSPCACWHRTAPHRTSAPRYPNPCATAGRRIAGYIFGGNKSTSKPGNESIAMTSPVIMKKAGSSSEKIAMTSPVAMQQNEQGEYTMAFVMPSKYSLSTLPKPDNEEVTLREVPGCMAAALSFSGSVSGEQLWRDKEQELMGLIKVGAA
jgi:hypothetical protein